VCQFIVVETDMSQIDFELVLLQQQVGPKFISVRIKKLEQKKKTARHACL
jgi:hypothetical protein